MLSYSSPDEWAKLNLEKTFTKAYVDAKSQHTLVTAYQNAMEKMEGSTIKIAWKKKTGGTVNTTVILVPVIYKNHPFALHFISK